MNYCPRCLEKDGVKVVGVKMTAKEKIADFVGGKIAEYIIIMDPPLSSPSLIYLLCKTIYRCPKCGEKWTRQNDIAAEAISKGMKEVKET